MFLKITYMIAAAQRASDIGKWDKLNIDSATESDELGMLLPCHLERDALLHGYVAKDRYLLRAIELIRTQKSTEFRFFVKRAGKNCMLVYFDTKVDGKRYQVSFHSFNKVLQRYVSGSVGSETCWDRKSSRNACITMMQSVS